MSHSLETKEGQGMPRDVVVLSVVTLSGLSYVDTRWRSNPKQATIPFPRKIIT